MKWIKASELKDIDPGREYIGRWKKEFVNSGKFENHSFWFNAECYGFIPVQKWDDLYILQADESPSPLSGEEIKPFDSVGELKKEIEELKEWRDRLIDEKNELKALLNSGKVTNGASQGKPDNSTSDGKQNNSSNSGEQQPVTGELYWKQRCLAAEEVINSLEYRRTYDGWVLKEKEDIDAKKEKWQQLKNQEVEPGQQKE